MVEFFRFLFFIIAMIKIQLFLISILGALAVIAGAFSAHLLERFVNQNIITLRELSIFEKAVRYQMYHVIVLLSLCLLNLSKNYIIFYYSFILIFLGIIFFSGSLYWISLQNIISITYPRFLFWITPLGGFLMIFGWFWIFLEGKKMI